MNLELVLGISIGVLGVVASILTGWYFYKRSERKRELRPYLHFASQVFDHIDRELITKMKILYEEDEIHNLFQVQFLIANTGSKSIRDCITPLTLHVGKDLEVLEANILHIHPKGRVINLNTDKSNIVFDFPLLDVGEYFIVKFLFKQTEASEKDLVKGKEGFILDNLSFEITLDELPPKLKIEGLPFESISGLFSPKWGRRTVTLFVISFFIFYFHSITLISLGDIDNTYSILNFNAFLSNFSMFHFLIFMSWIGVFMELTLFAFLMMEGGYGRFFRKKPKFVIPEKLL